MVFIKLYIFIFDCNTDRHQIAVMELDVGKKMAPTSRTLLLTRREDLLMKKLYKIWRRKLKFVLFFNPSLDVHTYRHAVFVFGYITAHFYLPFSE